MVVFAGCCFSRAAAAVMYTRAIFIAVPYVYAKLFVFVQKVALFSLIVFFMSDFMLQIRGCLFRMKIGGFREPKEGG